LSLIQEIYRIIDVPVTQVNIPHTSKSMLALPVSDKPSKFLTIKINKPMSVATKIRTGMA
jgi:hypothetical protein